VSAKPTIKIIYSINEIGQTQWRPIEDPTSPFADFEYLSSLEESKSVGGRSGWAPIYVTHWTQDTLTGAIILFAKTNSYGEYIFDWSWANAAIRAQIPYYPKLLSAIPFTPVSCKKFLTHPEFNEAEISTSLLQTSIDLRASNNLASLNFLFTSSKENALLEKNNFLIRESFQYHWKNQGFENFEHFLKSFKTKKAKQVRKERAPMQALEITQLTGDQIKEQDGINFYQYYLSTIEDKGSMAYLTEDFFRLIFTRMRDRILLIKAGDYAQALFFFKGDKLFGRYWGATKQVEFLHFELCYYQGIDFAIKNKLKVFEAGAQGEHKIARGFIPTRTYSAHDFDHPGLKDAVAHFIKEEQASIQATFAYFDDHLPYASVPE
jgi:predicted N-acyltransferase